MRVFRPSRLISACSLAAAALLLACATLSAAAQTFQITSAVFTDSNSIRSSFVPAGSNGATLLLTGTLPTDATQSQAPVLACFFTGFGSTAGIQPSLPTSATTEPLTVPASTIETVPQSSFTAANNFQITARVYFVASGGVCDGTVDTRLSNQFPIAVRAPSLLAYTGPTSIPQTNTSSQSTPQRLTLPVRGLLSDTQTNGTQATVTFGSFGSPAASLLGSSSISIPIPATFASSTPGTTAALSLCTTPPAGNAVCTASPITLTVAVLGTATSTTLADPNPVLASAQATLSAQFVPPAGTPGAPAGLVTLSTDGTALPATRLVLDRTATFTTQTTSVTTPTVATPTLSPMAGNYTSAQTITLADVTPGASLFFTQDGSTPTASSTPYTAPFSINTSQTIQAIATLSGLANSAVASAAYTITLRPASQLAFAVQPANASIGGVLTPAVQVAVEDSTGAVVTSATNAVTLILRANPGEATLGGTLTQNAVNGIATFPDLTLNQVATGYTLNASSPSLTSAVSSAFNITPAALTVTVQSALVGIASTLNGTVSIGRAAPAGGVGVTLSSDTPANVTVAPTNLTIAQGQTSGAFTYTGVASGPATLSASATNYLTGTTLVTGTSAQVSLSLIPPVAPGQSVSLALSLATAAPPGGTTVTFTSSNPSIATVSASLFVPAGQQTAATNPQVTGILIGSTVITANAPGYAPAMRTAKVTVTPSINPSTTAINLSTSTNTTLNITAPAPAGGITFTLSSDDPTTVTVPTSVTIIQGSTSVSLPITGVQAGNTIIRADSPGVVEATGAVSVYSAINGGSLTTGYDMEVSSGFYLPVAPPNPTTVTVTSNNPAIAVLSTSASVAGQTTLTFPNTTSNYFGTIYVQGLSIGTTTLTLSAPGYQNGTTTITVDPSGFVYYGTPSFSTTSFSTPTNNGLYPVPLDPTTLNVVGFFAYTINPNSAPISIPVTSSDTTVGRIVTSPVVFKPGDTGETISFQPVGPGTANLTAGPPPAGFATSAQYEQIVATVTAPAVTPPNILTGVNLQNGSGIYLPVSPPTPVDVTVTLVSPGARFVSLSNTATAAGTSTLTYTAVSGQYIGNLYADGTVAGTATYTISAPGYTTGTGTITVDPSGFAF